MTEGANGGTIASSTVGSIDELCFAGMNLNHRDFHRILIKLNSDREPRPRKSRRPLNALDEEIAKLSSDTRPAKLRFAGNAIGNRAMEYLHLIPDSVRELNFSRCALGIEGTETLCEFMAGNKHIQVLNIQCNVLLWRRCLVAADEACLLVQRRKSRGTTTNEITRE